MILGFDGSYTGSLGVMLVNGSPCAVTPDGRLVAWYENWMKA